MPDTPTKQPETVADGGFRIEIGTDDLTVTADRSAWKARKRSVASRMYVALFAMVVAALFMVRTADDGWQAFVLLALILGIAAIVGWLQRTRNIYFTREAFEVIEMLHKREVGRVRYSREQVQRIEFAPVSYGRYQAVFGLVFRVDGKKVKVLRGVESPEAQIVLRELKRLGFDAVIDVGMPMAAEMALERRNSWWA